MALFFTSLYKIESSKVSEICVLTVQIMYDITIIIAWLDSASYSVPFFGAGARWVLFDSASYSVPCFGADAR